MKPPKRPNREPDFVISDYSFWWEEGIWTLGHFSYHIDLVKWTYYSFFFEGWVEFVVEEHFDKIREAYADWLIEKELL